VDASAPWRALEAPDESKPERPPERPRADGLLILLAIVAGLVACSFGAIALSISRQGGQVEVVSGAGDSAAPTVPAQMLVVEVAGAVAHPGVYSLPQGSRASDAITAAGGYSPDVDPRQVEAQLNLAAKLQDGEVVRVPRRGDGASPTQAGASGGLVNLNTATSELLDTLPGVGPATAAKILASRDKQPFASVDDLVTRKVVSATTLAKFRDLVTVS
jgi:competence protein ComEA